MITAAGARASDRVPDTMVVRHACVVFYAPSGLEYDSLISARPFWFDSLGHRFATTVRGVRPFLNKTGLETVETSATTLLFVGNDTMGIVRRPFVDLFGTICFAPGRAPLVLQGVRSESAVIQAVIGYFHIK